MGIRYTSELLDNVLFRAGELIGNGASDFEPIALDYLNRAYMTVCNGGSDLDPSVREDWWFLRKTPSGVLNLEPLISTGTVACTVGSASITFSNAPSLSTANWFFQTTDHPDVFRIATHSGASTSATLDSIYTGTTGTTKPFRLFKLDYNLAADFLRLTAPMRVYRPAFGTLRRYQIFGRDVTDMEEEYPLAVIEAGVPEYFAQIGETTVRFNRAGSTSTNGYIRVEYDYIYRPASLTNSTVEEPVLPLERRSILVDYALALLLDTKDDSRSASILEFARRGLLSMQLENRHRLTEQNPNAGRVLPRGSHTLTRYPLRTASGLIIGD